MTPTDFVFPAGATAPVALEVTRAFYGSSSWRELLPYCGALDAFIRAEPPVDGRDPGPSRMWRAVSSRVPVDRLLPLERHPPWSGDALVVGECARPAELALMRRLVGGLVESGRTVLYLCANKMEERGLRAAARRRAWERRLTLWRIPTAEHAPSRFWLSPAAWRRLEADWGLMAPLLQEAGAHLGRDARSVLRETATAKVQWGRLRAQVRFGAAVVRTRYLPLSAALLADCAGSSRPTVSFQHGVVTSPASFAPVSAKRYVCFGERSRSLLETLDMDLARASGRERICRELLPAGSLVDAVPEVSGPRRKRTALVIDQSSAWARRYFGGTPAQHRAPFRAAEALAGEVRGIDRVVVRLHPAGEATREWQALARRVGGRIELASGHRPLEEDLGRASVVAGLFSTALPVAAAAGLPTFFLRDEGWFYTPDLSPFAPEQLVTPDSLVERVGAAMADDAAYEGERERCRAAGSAYFPGGRACTFDPVFIDRMLAPVPR